MKPNMSREEVGAVVTRDIAQKWRSLTAEERTVHEEMAAKDKKRYALELVEWKQSQEAAAGTASSVSLAPAPEIVMPWASSASAAGQQHTGTVATQAQETNQASGENAYLSQDRSGIPGHRQKLSEDDSLELPPLPLQMRQPTRQSQVRMTPEQYRRLIAEFQRQQQQTQDGLHGMAVFREGNVGAMQSQSSSWPLPFRGFDYQREIRRVADELGQDGADLVIRLFRDAA